MSTINRLDWVRHSAVDGGGYFFRKTALSRVYWVIERSHFILPILNGSHLDRMAAVLIPEDAREFYDAIINLQAIMGLAETGFVTSRFCFPGCDFRFPFIEKSLPDSDGVESCFRLILVREAQFRAILDAMEMAIDCEHKEYEETGNDSLSFVAREKFSKIAGPFLNASFEP